MAPNQVRLLTSDDLPRITRLLNTSEYIYQRFTFDELPALLVHYPTFGVFHGSTLHSFLLSQTVNPPSAWIGGFGVSWTESRHYIKLLDMLLEHLAPHLVKRGVHYLHYSGNDMQHDWLRDLLLMRGFMLHRQLYAYDKFDYRIPTWGNAQVVLRPFEMQDIPTLLALEEVCFDELWRYDAVSFSDIAATHPYFMVGELDGKVVGYQFNALDGEFGYLVRIAVHPAVNGRGIGSRFMAEAIRFFQKARVLRIMLNTQEENTHAHQLYERFGFMRIPQIGFVLRRYL